MPITDLEHFAEKHTNGELTQEGLATLFGVSTRTIQRKLKALQDKNRIGKSPMGRPQKVRAFTSSPIVEMQESRGF